MPSPHTPSPTPHTPPMRAFTIIELLVAISIIGILIAITIPVIGAMGEGTRESSAVNSISAGVKVARYYATRKMNDRDVGGTIVPYRGAAAIVTHANEVRIVEHNQAAANGGTVLETVNNSDGKYRVGMQDVRDAEYLRFPTGVQVYGFTRGGTGPTGLRLVAPPFAIYFDQDGHLISGNANNQDRLVTYDGNGDGNFAYTNGRPAPYTPPTPSLVSGGTKYSLPFERLETVQGLYVVERSGAYATGTETGSNTSGHIGSGDTDYATIKAGRLVFFSRYSGNPMRTD